MLTHLNQDRNKHRSRKQFEIMFFVVRGREINFFIGIINITINLTCIMSRSEGLKLKHTDFHVTRHSLMDLSHVDYCDVFISCLDSHSDGTHSLQRRVMTYISPYLF